MEKSKIIIEPFILNKISCSTNLTDNEKINFLQHVGYMTISEKKELAEMI